MGILENLAQGFANAAGATDASQAIQKNKDDRRATQKEELQVNTDQIFNDLKGLQARKLQLNPQSPTYQKDAAEIDAAMQKAQQAFHDLYHPAKNPGALEHLGGFINNHFPGHPKVAAHVPQTPGQAKESMQQTISGLNSAAGTPNAPENPYLTKKRQITEAGGTPEDVQRGVFGAEKAEQQAWKLVDVTMPDGTVKTVQHNEKDRTFSDLAGNPIAAAELAGARMAPRNAPKPVRAWVSKGGKTTSILLDPTTNKPIPGSENPDILPPASMGGRVTTGYYHFVDSDGNVHQVQETKTSTPIGAGGASIPKTPKEAKDAIKPPAGSKDNVLGHKGTPSETKARTEYNEAVKLDSIAKQVEQNPNDAVNQKRLAVALERVSAGRFTTQALDYIVKAGIANSIEGWMNSATTGALPKDVMRQLIEGAHQNLKASKDALDAAKGTPADSDDDEFLKKIKPN